MKKIKTALASFGMSGTVFHAPFLDLHPGFELYAAWERSKNLAAARYPGIHTYRSYSELLADNEIDLVVVNTPNYTHFELAREALLAGKHVVVEKPFTVSTQESDELIALSKLQNKVLTVFQNRRWDSDFLTLQKVVNEKMLGEVVEAEFHFDRYNQELSPKLHKETPGPGTGILYDLGSHMIDQALLLFGMPEAVFGDLAKMRPVSFVDDYMEILLIYPAMRVRIKGTYLARETFPSFVLHGTKGSFLKTRSDNQENRLQAGDSPGSADWGTDPESERGLLHTEIDGRVIREYIPSETGGYMAFYSQLYKAITEGQPLPVAPGDGRNVIQIIEKAKQSAELGKVVSI